MSARQFQSRSLTLNEVIISMTIFTLVLGAFTTLVDITRDASTEANGLISKRIELDQASQTIARELRLAVVESISRPNPDEEAKIIEYRVQKSFIENANPDIPPTLVLSKRRRMKVVQDGSEILGNSIDDDGDGVVDEGIVVLEHLEENGAVTSSIPIINYVTKLSFRRDSRPAIFVTIERSVIDVVASRNAQTTVTANVAANRQVFLANSQPRGNFVYE